MSESWFETQDLEALRESAQQLGAANVGTLSREELIEALRTAQGQAGSEGARSSDTGIADAGDAGRAGAGRYSAEGIGQQEGPGGPGATARGAT